MGHHPQRPGLCGVVDSNLLAVALGALYAGRPVLDRTGLKGLYEIKLQWTADSGLAAPVNPGEAATSPSVPSLFSALEEQLGLKLEALPNVDSWRWNLIVLDF